MITDEDIDAIVEYYDVKHEVNDKGVNIWLYSGTRVFGDPSPPVAEIVIQREDYIVECLKLSSIVQNPSDGTLNWGISKQLRIHEINGKDEEDWNLVVVDNNLIAPFIADVMSLAQLVDVDTVFDMTAEA